MLSRKLAFCSVLALSVASAIWVGTPSSAQAGEGRCGDSPLPCNEPQQPNHPKVHINYTLENKTKRTIKFALPSGKTYQLAPDQRGSYTNTATPDRLRVFVFSENKFYPLRSGKYQFRQTTKGINLVRMLPHQQTGVHRSLGASRSELRLTSPSRTPIPRRTLTPLIPSSDIPSSEVSNSELDGNAQTETILPLLIDKVGDVLIELIRHQSTASGTPDSVSEEVQPPENSEATNDGSSASPEESQPPDTTDPASSQTEQPSEESSSPLSEE